MKTEVSKPKTLIITAWVALLLGGMPFASLPKIILQEIFDYQFPSNLEYGIAAVVGILGLGLTFAWSAISALRPYFILLLVFAGAAWLVFVWISGLPIYEGWLAHPSPNVALPAFLSRSLMVSLGLQRCSS